MSILAIDGATPVAGVALVDSGKIKGELFNQQGTGHARTLMGMVDYLLSMTETDLPDIKAIAVTVGPGSFTGLRIGLATAEGLATALSLPIVGISTLEVLATPLAMLPALVVPVLNARKNEVYSAIYSGGLDGMKIIDEEKAVAPEIQVANIRKALAVTGHEMVALTGDGIEPYCELWERELGDCLLPVSAYHSRPRAGVLGCLAEDRFRQGLALSPLEIKPSYLRLSEAESKLQAK
ncbi:MAG: tRNA (adenosine(37)-N6)-threonylcarbamoyltransferase complex dimerization subunit type 1 TsaB [Methanomassiliicoccales archaeon]